jgi:hypothetical protein
MAFTDLEISEHMRVIENSFWAQRRPPIHMRDQVREGQRFTGHSIELFIVRPAYQRPGEQFEEPIAKVQFVGSRSIWRIFWKRADNKWHGYTPHPEADTLAAALHVIDEDANNCFFG